MVVRESNFDVAKDFFKEVVLNTCMMEKLNEYVLKNTEKHTHENIYKTLCLLDTILKTAVKHDLFLSVYEVFEKSCLDEIEDLQTKLHLNPLIINKLQEIIVEHCEMEDCETSPDEQNNEQSKSLTFNI